MMIDGKGLQRNYQLTKDTFVGIRRYISSSPDVENDSTAIALARNLSRSSSVQFTVLSCATAAVHQCRRYQPSVIQT